ncbi:MAG: response regulator [Pseudolabrys sp.]|nr:response regulator [Pseudolabrys sp.]
MMGNAEQNVVMLPPILDQAAAESFLELMRQRVSGDAPLALDASEVETLTLPCAQVVLAVLRAGDSIKIRNPSAAFVATFEDFGLDWQAHLDHSRISEDASEEPDLTGAATEATPAETALSFDADIPPISEKVMSKRILTIDDSKTIRDMLMLTLAEAGFDVIQAVDGQDGLDVLAKEKDEVDVIITDINMPRMDGYEVIRNLRRDPTYKSKPILVLTTESDGDKKNQAREAGATGWMVKPFDPERLVATVRKVAP